MISACQSVVVRKCPDGKESAWSHWLKKACLRMARLSLNLFATDTLEPLQSFISKSYLIRCGTQGRSLGCGRTFPVILFRTVSLTGWPCNRRHVFRQLCLFPSHLMKANLHHLQSRD